MPKTPHPFQLPVIESLQHQNTAVFDDLGLGKTLMAIEGVKPIIGPKLVICPPKLKQQWMEEIVEQSPADPVYVLGSAGSSPKDFNWSYVQDGYNIWVVVHYEALLYIGPELVRHTWAAIILDEAHRIKNRKAKRTIWSNMLKTDRKAALTGMPMEKHIDDLYSVFHWLYPKQFSSYWKFRERFVEVKIHPRLGFQEVVGPKNLDELMQLIGPWTYRRTKQEVAPELPPKIYQDVHLEMEPQQQKLYDSIANAKDIEVEISSDLLADGDDEDINYMVIRNALAKMVRLQQVTSDPHLLGYGITGIKEEWVCDFVEDNPDTSMIVFTRFRDTAVRLSAKLRASLLVGGQRPTAQIAPWLVGKKQVLVGTIDSMGEGLNLQRASVAVFLDLHWSSLKMQQAEDRIHRIDITEPKQIIHLVAANSIDLLIKEALAKKWSEHELVLNYIQSYH